MSFPIDLASVVLPTWRGPNKATADACPITPITGGACAVLFFGIKGINIASMIGYVFRNYKIYKLVNANIHLKAAFNFHPITTIMTTRELHLVWPGELHQNKIL